MKEMNMNAVRMSHYPPDVHFLEACDELGLYVLDELAGWQGAYDTPTGVRLIGQIVRRDVNHPSILFWDNGNEGGWNTEVDGEFAKWDPQRRPVLHPWAKMSEIDTDHYEVWDSHVKLCKGPMIYMPTEFLHGLYDGGHGAGLRDYWNEIMKSPTAAGGFLWSFADEGVARADQNGRIDCRGNLAPDGIVGPHHEREGSFYTIKEIWSPLQVALPKEIPADWDGTLKVENHYDFTNLDQCRFEWALAEIPWQDEFGLGQKIVAQGDFSGPPVGPHGLGTITLPVSESWHGYKSRILRLTAKDPRGSGIWTWSADVPLGWVSGGNTNKPKVTASDTTEQSMIRVGPLELIFDKADGLLREVRKDGKRFSLSGPRFVAFRRKDRSYEAIPAVGKLVSFTTTPKDLGAEVLATFTGPLRQLTWRVNALTAKPEANPTITAYLKYEYETDGVFDILGIRFDYPESLIKAKRWLGYGPYRVWQNRMEGGVLDIHEVAYNDPVPGESFTYPEFKGFFRDCSWLTLLTDEGRIRIGVGAPFVGLYKPKDGVGGLVDLPDVGLAFLDVIPAQRNKFHSQDQLGPQSQPQKVSGVRKGSLTFRFDAP
jgi:hypothetical protein